VIAKWKNIAMTGGLQRKLTSMIQMDTTVGIIGIGVMVGRCHLPGEPIWRAVMYQHIHLALSER